MTEMMPVTPDVALIGTTAFFGFNVPESVAMEIDEDAEGFESQHLIEFAGRLCYMSQNKPNPATRSNRDYIRNVIAQRHYSVLEHVSATFYVGGVSRNFTHELVRHRHLSFSELSGRYVDPFKAGLGYVVPPNMPERAGYALAHVWVDAENNYYECLDELARAGVTGKKAREAARAFIPGSLETRITVSGNLRSWLEFVSKRNHPAADAEMQQVAEAIWTHLEECYPAVFSPDVRDLWDEQFAQSAVKDSTSTS